MPDLQGLATFPGVSQLLDCSISLVHGISPSVALLTIAPQADFAAEGGTLRFTFGDVTIDFPNCKVDAQSLQRNAAGEIWRLSILDRRWKWAWGAISGAYNLRGDNGALVAGTEKTPRELAALCLNALGETGYDVADLPNDARPLVEWDCDAPAEGLAQLCDELGARVVLTLDNIVALRQLGVGEALPTDGVLENSLTIDPPEVPTAIAIVCAPNRFQVDFELEAVGLEEDGAIKLIDDLSYKPSGGWSTIDLPYFVGAYGDSGGGVSGRLVERAKRSVFKWYRIKTPVTIPGYGEVSSLDQLILESEQVETISAGGTPRNKPAMVFGSWRLSFDDAKNTVNDVLPVVTGTALRAIFTRSFLIDARRRLVKFGDFVFRNTETASDPAKETIGPAILRLRTAVSVRDPATRAVVRHTRQRTLGTFDTPTRYVKHDELTLVSTPNYDPANYDLLSVTDNQAAIDATCDRWLDAIAAQYQTATPQAIKYAGLRAIQPDGAIEQVVFSVGQRGATTRAVRHGELLGHTLSHKQRRHLERARRASELQRAAAPSIRRLSNKTLQGLGGEFPYAVSE